MVIVKRTAISLQPYANAFKNALFVRTIGDRNQLDEDTVKADINIV